MNILILTLFIPLIAKADYCAPDCDPTMLLDSLCQSTCNTSACGYDNGSCLCSPGCFPEYISDTTCHSECNNPSCNYQNNLCGTCSSDCFYNMTGNGVCDLACNNSACSYDLGDCSCAVGCLSYFDYNSNT